MKRLHGSGAAFLITVVLILLMSTACGEETLRILPPTPEPPEAGLWIRPTPAPTEPPADIIVDHIHNPSDHPDYRFPKDAKLLEIWFPNIRDADEAILMYDGQVWMIDCGDERAASRGVLLLKQLGIEKIETLFNSHLHHDHINGLALTDDTARVQEVRICFQPDLTESGLRLIRVAEERQIPIREFKSGDIFTMGDGAVKLLFLKNNESYLDMNNQSAQTLITYGERSILFTADMEAAGHLSHAYLIAAPHHVRGGQGRRRTDCSFQQGNADGLYGGERKVYTPGHRRKILALRTGGNNGEMRASFRRFFIFNSNDRYPGRTNSEEEGPSGSC